MAALVERFNAEMVSFNVGRDAIISFDVGEFAAVMGLRYTNPLWLIIGEEWPIQ